MCDRTGSLRSEKESDETGGLSGNDPVIGTTGLIRPFASNFAALWSTHGRQGRQVANGQLLCIGAWKGKHRMWRNG